MNAGRAIRREFTVADQKAIVARATDADGKIKCEQCGAWVKSRKDYEIDHVISEGIRPAADKKRKLKPADGQLLCKAICHKAKSARDVGDIGQAKRREARSAGIERPGKVGDRAACRSLRRSRSGWLLDGQDWRGGTSEAGASSWQPSSGFLGPLKGTHATISPAYGITHGPIPSIAGVRLPVGVPSPGKPRLAPAREVSDPHPSAPVADERARAIEQLRAMLNTAAQ